MRLALGTAQFGLNYGIANGAGQVHRNEIGNILNIANKAGIDTLDTAIGYGNSEFELGAIGIGNWRVVTKLSPIPPGITDLHRWVQDEVRGSLERLQVKKLYGLLLHRPDQLFDSTGSDLLAALRNLKDQGIVSKIGVSIYAPDELNRLFDLTHFDIVQAPLSILDRRLVDSQWASRLRMEGVELHTRSAFLQGLLLMSEKDRPPKFGRWSVIWDAWADWLSKSNLSPLQACILYPLTVDAVDKLIVGVDSAKHLREILSACSASLHNLPEWPVVPDIELLNPAMWSQL